MKRAFLAVSAPALLVLASCTTAETLDPSAILPDPVPPAAEGTAPSDTPSTGTGPAPAAQAALSRPASIQLAPLVGATEMAAAPLAARLTTLAAGRGITVTREGERAGEFLLRGYFSAFTEDRQTTVIFVWDVLDPAGNRLHRIQGQQKAEGVQGEGWSAVTPEAMEAIAEQTVSQLAAWLSTRAG